MIPGLLRSVIDYGDAHPEHLLTNLQQLMRSQYEWDPESPDAKIYSSIKNYFELRYEVPSVRVLEDIFVDNLEVSERLKDITADPLFVRSNFQYLLEKAIDTLNSVKMDYLLRIAGEIKRVGMDIDGTHYKGVAASVEFLQKESTKLLSSNANTKFESCLNRESDLAWDDYLRAKANRSKSLRTGIAAIDTVLEGINPGELWVHAGFAGEFKTSFALNWAYNAIVRFGRNVFYASLEMPLDQIRRQVFMLHSVHPKYKGCPKLDYKRLKSGKLTAIEEDFYQEVLRDFKENPKYGEFNVWCAPKDTDFDGISVALNSFHAQAPQHLLVVDHGSIVEARKQKKSRDFVVERNSVVRDAKQLALTHDRNNGIPVLLLFQINREGKLRADKNNGVYDLQSLSYANECERSADIITTTYKPLDEQGEVKFSNIKVRDGAPFKPFNCKIEFPSKKMHSVQAMEGTISEEEARKMQESILGL